MGKQVTRVECPYIKLHVNSSTNNLLISAALLSETNCEQPTRRYSPESPLELYPKAKSALLLSVTLFSEDLAFKTLPNLLAASKTKQKHPICAGKVVQICKFIIPSSSFWSFHTYAHSTAWVHPCKIVLASPSIDFDRRLPFIFSWSKNATQFTPADFFFSWWTTCRQPRVLTAWSSVVYFICAVPQIHIYAYI